MKLRGWIIAVLFLFAIQGTNVLAQSRVIAEVTALTDHSARISLSWSDDNTSQGVMITGWRFEEERLVVTYRTGNDVPVGFSTRTVTHESYTFPMQVLLEGEGSEVKVFSDMTEATEGYGSIMNLYHRGIIGGYPDGTFQALNNVTRAEFSKMLLMTAEYTLDTSLNSTFTDVRNDYWGKAFIMTLASKGILNGKGNQTFDPTGQIKIGEVLAVITRTFDLYGEENSYPYTLTDHWSNTAFKNAVADNIILPTDTLYKNYTPETPATRAQCAIFLSRVLESLHDVR